MSNATAPFDFVPAADVSFNALNTLIGAGWDQILTGGNPTGAGGVLLDIMDAFNAVGLAVAVIMIFYQINAGVLDTAHQGEALGKSRSTLWVPLRLAGGVAMLMPLPWCQASLLQAIILKCVFLSIAGADYINTQVTNQITANGGHITAPAIPENINEVASSLLRGVAIQEYYKLEMSMSGSDDLLISRDSSGAFYKLGLSSPDPDVNNDYLGYINVPCSLGTGDPVCQARVNAIQAMLPTLRLIATTFTDCYTCASISAQPGWMIGAMQTYQSSVQTALISWIQSQQPTEDSAISQFAQVAQNQGWASLGSWYWTMAHFNEAALKTGTSVPVVGALPDMNLFGDKGYHNIKTTFENTDHYLTKVSSIAEISGSMDIAAPNAKYSAGWFNKIFPSTLFANLGAKGVNAMSQGDPVSNMQSVGQGLVAAAELGTLGASTAYGAIHAVAGAADGVKSSLLGLIGIGTAAKAPAEFAVGAADFMKEIFHELLSACFFIGLCLSYYLPSIPYIIWSLAFIGWLILVVEALIAAPVWATAHALPEGEGFIGQSARRGYMLLLNILLRPALMTTSFYISFLLMPVVGSFIGNGFRVFVSGLMNNSPGTGMAMDVAGLGIGGIIAGLATVAVGGVLLAMSEHAVFGLITWLPENVMRWVEGQMGGLGEHEKENKIQGLVMAKFGRSENASRASRRGSKSKPEGEKGRFSGD